jgi:hypothetical protein
MFYFEQGQNSHYVYEEGFVYLYRHSEHITQVVCFVDMTQLTNLTVSDIKVRGVFSCICRKYLVIVLHSTFYLPVFLKIS